MGKLLELEKLVTLDTLSGYSKLLGEYQQLRIANEAFFSARRYEGKENYLEGVGNASVFAHGSSPLICNFKFNFISSLNLFRVDLELE